MRARELVGKLAIRTAPAENGDGFSDRSYMDRPLKIIAYQRDPITYGYGDEFTEKSTLPYFWDDDNWALWPKSPLPPNISKAIEAGDFGCRKADVEALVVAIMNEAKK